MKKTIVLLCFGILPFVFCEAQVGFQENIVYDSNIDFVQPSHTISRDFDGDGDIDVLSFSNEDGEIVLFENIDGQGTFSFKKTIASVSYSIESLLAEDLNGDGDIDVLFSEKNGAEVAWLENLGGFGNFAPKVVIASDYNSNTLEIADLDSDGNLDIISGTSNALIWYKSISGSGSFETESVIISSNSNHIKTADFDNDGDLDILVSFDSNPDTNLSWFENTDGLGNFSATPTIIMQVNIYDWDSQPKLTEVSDLDNDGDMDVVIFTNQGGMTWYKNDNNGDFSIGGFLGSEDTTVNSLSSVDLNQDGLTDLVYSFSPGNDPGIVWFKNIGSTNFEKVDITNAVSSHSYLSLSDINNDGFLDFVSNSLNDTFKVVWYKHIDGNGVFSNPRSISSSSYENYPVIKLADIDNDGDEDIVSSSIFITLGFAQFASYANIDGQGNFASQNLIDDGIMNTHIPFFATGDINNDGSQDAVYISHNDKTITWYKNIANFHLIGTKQIISQNTFDITASVDLFDLDADNDLDILYSKNDTEVVWLENLDGQGNFAPEQTIASLPGMVGGWLAVSFVDINGDSLKDLVYASWQQNPVMWQANLDGNGNFGSIQNISSSVYESHGMKTGDIDGDGDIDVVVSAGLNNEFVWFENTDGLGNFQIGQTYATSTGDIESLDLADFDNDGDLDITLVFSSFTSDTLIWIENSDGSGSLGSENIISEGDGGVSSLFASDMNGDGNMDVVYASKDKISWYENLGSFPNRIVGTVRLDLEGNGCSIQDEVQENILVTSNNSINSFATFTDSNGNFIFHANQDLFTTQITPVLPNYFVSNPVSFIHDFTGQTGSVASADFCIEAGSQVKDLEVTVYPFPSGALPNADAHYILVYKNTGNTIESGSIDFEYDDSKMQFSNATQGVVSNTSGTVSFGFSNLLPFETREILIEFETFAPPITNVGDVLSFTAKILPLSGDVSPENNTFSFDQEVVGSFYSTVLQSMEPGQLPFSEAEDAYFHYIVAYQNTGSSPVNNLVIEQILDTKFDINTLQVENTSHSASISISDETQISFQFNQLGLPISTVNLLDSYAFIAYKIKPKDNVQIGDVFSSVANIYANLSLSTTNMVTTEIINDGILNVSSFESGLRMYPNPTNTDTSIRSLHTPFDEIRVFDINGRLIQHLKFVNSINEYALKTDHLSSGIYFVEIQSGTTKHLNKLIKH